jgi:hypothetical protein
MNIILREGYHILTISCLTQQAVRSPVSCRLTAVPGWPETRSCRGDSQVTALLYRRRFPDLEHQALTATVLPMALVLGYFARVRVFKLVSTANEDILGTWMRAEFNGIGRKYSVDECRGHPAQV